MIVPKRFFPDDAGVDESFDDTNLFICWLADRANEGHLRETIVPDATTWGSEDGDNVIDLDFWRENVCGGPERRRQKHEAAKLRIKEQTRRAREAIEAYRIADRERRAAEKEIGRRPRPRLRPELFPQRHFLLPPTPPSPPPPPRDPRRHIEAAARFRAIGMEEEALIAERLEQDRIALER